MVTATRWLRRHLVLIVGVLVLTYTFVPIGYIIALSSKTFNSAQTFAMLFIFVFFCVAMVGLTQLLERKASVWRA